MHTAGKQLRWILFFMLLVPVLAFILGGCGGSSETETTKTAATSAAVTTTSTTTPVKTTTSTAKSTTTTKSAVTTTSKTATQSATTETSVGTETYEIMNAVLDKLDVRYELKWMYAEAIGAVEGFKYTTNRGEFELYKYDMDSDAYKDAVKNSAFSVSGTLFPAIIRDGYAWYFYPGVSESFQQQVMDAFFP